MTTLLRRFGNKKNWEKLVDEDYPLENSSEIETGVIVLDDPPEDVIEPHLISMRHDGTLDGTGKIITLKMKCHHNSRMYDTVQIPGCSADYCAKLDLLIQKSKAIDCPIVVDFASLNRTDPKTLLTTFKIKK